MKLTTGKKKQGNAVSKGAKIGSAIGALSGLAAKTPVGGRLGGTMASAVGGAVLGAGIGAGVKGVKAAKNKLTNKKAKFNNTDLTEFTDSIIVAGFPTITVKEEANKSVLELANEKLKNKDKLPDDCSPVSANIYNTYYSI
jgi:hypothetical protein